MLGGLYGDLPPPSASSSSLVEEENNGNSYNAQSSSMWSSSTKMAPPTLRKPTTLFASPQSIIRNQQQQQQQPAKPKSSSSFPATQQTRPAPSSIGPWSNEGSISPLGGEAKPPSPPYQPALVGVTSTVMEEYDPCRPNDYEEYRRERRRRAVEAEMRRELERRRQEEEEREALRELEGQRGEAAEKEKEGGESRTVALNISGEEAWMRRGAMGAGRSEAGASAAMAPRSPSPPPGGDGFSIGKSSTGGLGVGAGGHMTAAQRMMARMGWKEGQGLGKQEQGITTPLMARKTDRRAGVIVNASESRQEKKLKGATFTGTPTRVVLLRNMVGPGEVDDELEDEVASECAKYGTVTRVLIFEITEPDFPSDEAVRIFVQFERAEQTTKALVDLDGRFFAGRVVHASFYDEERFSRNELAPAPGEVPSYSQS